MEPLRVCRNNYGKDGICEKTSVFVKMHLNFKVSTIVAFPVSLRQTKRDFKHVIALRIYPTHPGNFRFAFTVGQ